MTSTRIADNVAWHIHKEAKKEKQAKQPKAAWPQPQATETTQAAQTPGPHRRQVRGVGG